MSKKFSFLISVQLIFALSLSNPAQLPVSLFKEILKQSSKCSDIPWIRSAPHPSHLSGIHIFTCFSFYCHTALLHLISAPSTSTPVCGSNSSVLFYQTLNYKTNLGQSFAATCPACAHSEEAEALLLIKRWVWELEQNF